MDGRTLIDGALRERNVVKWARIARADKRMFRAALLLVLIYSLITLADISSTIIALNGGSAYEVNPLMRGLMGYGSAWIAVKLLLQGFVSFMILWFPHRLVLTIFFPVMAFNGAIVLNNWGIAGLF